MMMEDNKVIRWTLYSVLIGLIPLFLRGLLAMTNTTDQQFNWSSVIENGELILICAVLNARSAGELFTSEQKKTYSTMFSEWGCVVLLIVTSFWYAAILGNIAPDTTFVAHGSLYVFVLTLAVGVAAHTLVKMDDTV